MLLARFFGSRESLDLKANHIIEEARMVLPGNPGVHRGAATRAASNHALVVRSSTRAPFDLTVELPSETLLYSQYFFHRGWEHATHCSGTAA